MLWTPINMIGFQQCFYENKFNKSANTSALHSFLGFMKFTSLENKVTYCET